MTFKHLVASFLIAILGCLGRSEIQAQDKPGAANKPTAIATATADKIADYLAARQLFDVALKEAMGGSVKQVFAAQADLPIHYRFAIAFAAARPRLADMTGPDHNFGQSFGGLGANVVLDLIKDPGYVKAVVKNAASYAIDNPKLWNDARNSRFSLEMDFNKEMTPEVAARIARVIAVWESTKKDKERFIDAHTRMKEQLRLVLESDSATVKLLAKDVAFPETLSESRVRVKRLIDDALRESKADDSK